MKSKQLPLFAMVLIAALSVGFRFDSGRPMITSPNNVYVYDTLLLVSDSVNGLLIYSVADEQAPRYKARIPLKGNRGMAMKDSIIYANSWNAILALRMVNDTNYEVTSIVKTDPYHDGLGLIDDYYAPSPWHGGFGCAAEPLNDAGIPLSAGGSSGSGGSYAVFAVIDSFLYYIDNQSIITMDISNAALPRKLSETYVDWSIETLFPTQEYLFIGGSNGMYVMDRRSPAQPTQIGAITHFRARDPVVVQDSMAYVTLRNGVNWPPVNSDILMVVNIASVSNPKLIKEIPLPTPYGLAIRDTFLYVANGQNGWRLFTLKNPLNPVSLQIWPTPDVKDFIWIENRLYMMCFDRVKIYSVVDPRNPIALAEVQ
jgi:hypothetical protein